MDAKVFAHLIAGGVICATGACASDRGEEPRQDIYSVIYPADVEMTFVDSKGKAKTTLAIGKGSTCTGLIDGDNVKQTACSLKSTKGRINRDSVAVHWGSCSGSGSRDADQVVTYAKDLSIRIVKGGAGGYDCFASCTEMKALTSTTSARIDSPEQIAMSLTKAGGAGPTFATSETCSAAQKAVLENALARLSVIDELAVIACW
jgi:hypothetical protein